MLGLRRLVREALGEDVGQGDVTTKLTVPADARCRVRLTAKQDGVLSGIAVFRSVFDMLKARVQHWEAVEDGARFVSGDVLARFEGNTAAVLTGERVALNFVQRLSGIATITRQYADVVQDDLLQPYFTFGPGFIDWQAHIGSVADYWCHVLLYAPSYEIDAIEIHRHLHDEDPFTPELFDRWLAIFMDTVDGGWSGPVYCVGATNQGMIWSKVTTLPAPGATMKRMP